MDAAPTKKEFIRVQAIYYLYKTDQWDLALELSLVSDRQLKRWIKAFNEQGIDGLVVKAPPGRAPKVTAAFFDEQVQPLLDDPSQAQQFHWTGVKLHGYLKTSLEIDFSYRSLIRHLHKHDYRLKVPRPMPEPPDREVHQQQREAFIEQLGTLWEDEKVELWFADETGFEGDPRPRRQWAQKGEEPNTPYHGKHIRQSLIGAVNPKRGQISGVIFNHCDWEVFQCFLDELAQEAPLEDGIQQIVVLDNASWHKTKKLNWHHFTPMFLPPYSPDLNPVERLWLGLKSQFFAGFFTDKSEELIDRICEAFLYYFDSPTITRALCRPKLSL